MSEHNVKQLPVSDIVKLRKHCKNDLIQQALNNLRKATDKDIKPIEKETSIWTARIILEIILGT